jgi:phospholipid/cholesterol/gamma-HCH transport system permease protein
MRALGADPVKKLVVPRVVACIVALPLLTMLTNIVGLTGAMVITVREVSGVTPKFFYSQILDTLTIVELMHGLTKSVAFGYIVGIVGCYVGLNTHGGTEGVGNSTTRAVVMGAVGVLVSNFFLTQIYVAIYG